MVTTFTRTVVVWSLLVIGTCAGWRPGAAADAEVATPVATAAAAPPPNVQVSRGDQGAVSGEPSLAVNPQNPPNLLGGAMRRGDVPPGIATFASFDGGATWTDNGTLPDPRGFGGGFDVTVAFAADGTGVVVAGIDATGRQGIFAWRTADGGRTFAPPVAVHESENPDVFLDHPSLAAAAAADPHDNTLDVAWVQSTAKAAQSIPVGPIVASRSRDGGRTWSAPQTVSDASDSGSATGAVVATGPAGAVDVLYLALAGPPQGTTGVPATPKLASSSDGGRTFAAPQAVTPAPVLVAGLAAVAADPGDGTVYVASAEVPSGSTPPVVQVRASTDGGRTWTAPTAPADDVAVGGADRFQPELAARSGGVLFVSYFRLAGGRVDVVLARSADHGANFAPGRRIADAAFDPALGVSDEKRGGPLPAWIGDYQGLAAGPDAVHPFWNDTRTGSLQIFTAAVRQTD
jgi:hypothetical protein